MTLSKSLLWRFSKDETRVFHFPLSGSQWQMKHLLSKTGAVCYSGWSKVSNRLFLHEAARGDGGRSLWAVKPGPRAGSPQRGRHLPRGGAARWRAGGTAPSCGRHLLRQRGGLGKWRTGRRWALRGRRGSGRSRA